MHCREQEVNQVAQARKMLMWGNFSFTIADSAWSHTHQLGLITAGSDELVCLLCVENSSAV
jgi:hypothetical protein